MKQQRGLLIVLEGLDRCGKSTQVKMLKNFLEKEKQEVQMINFPDRSTSLGGVISSYLKGISELKDEAVHLLFSANRWEKFNEMKTYLERGGHIICDRYSYSGVAFSSAKGLPFKWCQSSDSRLIAPDLIIFLQAPQNVFSERGDFGQERYENTEFQQKVRIQFEHLIKSENMIVIQADQTIEDIHNNILEIIKAKLKEERNQIKYLWVDITQDIRKVNDEIV